MIRGEGTSTSCKFVRVGGSWPRSCLFRIVGVHWSGVPTDSASSHHLISSCLHKTLWKGVESVLKPEETETTTGNDVKNNNRWIEEAKTVKDGKQ